MDIVLIVIGALVLMLVLSWRTRASTRRTDQGAWSYGTRACGRRPALRR
jgi:hypothetical protein